MKLKIFSDRTYLPVGKEHVVMLYPFWGKRPAEPGDPDGGRYDGYAETGRSVFEMAPLEEADVAVLPADWGLTRGDVEAIGRAAQLVTAAGQAGKPTVVFFWSDLDEPIPLDGIVVFRTSLYRSQRKPTEFAMPAWSEDFVHAHLGGTLSPRPKGARPVVGFCGYAHAPKPRNRSWRERLNHWLHRIHPGSTGHGGRRQADATIRQSALQALSRSALVETNFLLRDRFLGGALLPSGKVDLAAMWRVRREYVQNMVGSDYVLCARGNGNYSYRLYETLSCGRIPVFVDTDCVLPYDFAVDWKKHCVWVERNEVARIGERVAEFHAALSPKAFVDLQQNCRRFWVEHLSPEGFFRNFYRHFPTRKRS